MNIKMKKPLIIILSAVIAIGVCGSGIVLYRKNSSGGKSVDVMPVSYICSMGMLNDNYTSGVVNSNQVQELYLQDQQTVKEVFVKDGDQVNIGDKLFNYDTALLELDMETKTLQIQQSENSIKAIKSEIVTLRNTKPITKTIETSSNEFIWKTMKSIDENSNLIDNSKINSLLANKDNNHNVKLMTEGDTEGEVILYKKIDVDSKPYSGDGTVDNPCKFLCTSDVVIMGGFMNKLMGYDVSGTKKETDPLVALFEVRIGDVKDGNLTCLWTMDGATYEPVKADSKWHFGVESDEKEPSEEVIPPVEPPVEEDGYTKEELAKLISKKEEELRNEELTKKESALDIEKIKKSLSKSTVLSTVKGTVKIKSSDDETGLATPYMVVNGGEGFYATGGISELLLGELKVGDGVTVQVWNESGQMQYNAVISEISQYPDTSVNYYNGGNTNVSYYPFTAFIAESEGLTNGQYVDMTMTASGDIDTNAFYINRSYIREENEKRYVYIADENDCLVKRYIKTGKVMYGEEIEIIEGLTQEDRIAFPYGKNVKEGVKVKNQEDVINNFK